MIAPVNVARSTMRRGLNCSWAYQSTSASTRRPSASVLSTSMVCPDMLVTMSPGRCAVPDGMFSVSPIRPTALTAALRAASASIRPATQAAPPMSPFMSSMPAAGLHGNAAGVEADAFADEAHRLGALRLGAVPLHHDHARGAARCLGRRQGERSSSALRAAPCRGFRRATPASARSRMRSANSTGPRMLAGSLTRSRARKTPSAIALRAANALAAASGLEQSTVKVCRPLRASAAWSFSSLRVRYFLKV